MHRNSYLQPRRSFWYKKQLTGSVILNKHLPVTFSHIYV